MKRGKINESFHTFTMKLSISLSILMFALSAPLIDLPTGHLIFYLAFFLFEIWLRLYKKLFKN